jgi:hypothetical protein
MIDGVPDSLTWEDHAMPSLFLDNVPAPVYDQIQRLALARNRTAADTALEVLETGLRNTALPGSTAPLPQEPFLTEEITAPFTIPRPPGERVVPIEITEYIPKPHDLPDTE